MRENKYQSGLIKRIKERFPDAMVLKKRKSGGGSYAAAAGGG